MVGDSVDISQNLVTGKRIRFLVKESTCFSVSLVEVFSHTDTLSNKKYEYNTRNSCGVLDLTIQDK